MKLYLESSVFNFIFADDAPEKQKVTKDFFADRLVNFEIFVSDIVFNELSKTKEPKRSELLGLLSDFPSKTLRSNEEAANLAMIYINYGVVPGVIEKLKVAIFMCEHYQVNYPNLKEIAMGIEII